MRMEGGLIGRIERLPARLSRGRLVDVDPRIVVACSAVAAALLRFPGLLYPIGSDEAGFTLVAREWDPRPDSLYGAYWVDRPPSLIALIKLSDAIGGPLFLRAVAAVGCVVMVLAAAAAARAALRYAGETDERFVTRTGAWTAVLTAAFVSSAMIDPVMAKGEILGIPFVTLSFWLALRALIRPRVDVPALGLAFAAGMSAVLAQGLKQNLVAGLVFGAVLLVGSRVQHRITTPELVRLALAALAGAAVPVVATVAWAVDAGVHLGELWYAVYGFRSDALRIITSEGPDGPGQRGLLLVGISLGTGAAFVLAGLVLHRRRVWVFNRTLAVATVAVVAVDVSSLVLGGSFWRPYLFAVVPGLVLCVALLLAVRDHVARRARVLVVIATVVSVLATAIWTVADRAGVGAPYPGRSGLALARAAEPGDTVVVYGGRSELVLNSGLTSPYEHLWSLPMRTLDPDLAELTSVLEGPDAPTWVVLWVPLSAWDDKGAPLSDPLVLDYEPHGTVCGGAELYLHEGLERPPLHLNCEESGMPVRLG
jgi:hypothetical protein